MKGIVLIGNTASAIPKLFLCRSEATEENQKETKRSNNIFTRIEGYELKGCLEYGNVMKDAFSPGYKTDPRTIWPPEWDVHVNNTDEDLHRTLKWRYLRAMEKVRGDRAEEEDENDMETEGMNNGEEAWYAEQVHYNSY
jgi:hypothetical protein